MIDEHPDPEDVAALHQLINEFNFDATGIRDGRDMAIIRRDGSGRIVAGIYGWTWGGCAEVDVLWVDAELRHGGVGTELMLAAEAESRARGCAQLVVDTHSFQAPDFYRRLGFEVRGEVAGYPVGHSHLRLVKQLRGE